MAMISLYQMKLKLPGQLKIKSQNDQQIPSFPFLFIFSVVNYFVLCRLEHKEDRFLSSLFIPMAISWAFAIYKFIQILPRNSRNNTLKLILIVYSIV